MEVSPVDDTLRSHLDIPAGQGLVVTSVHQGSAAERAGLKANDILYDREGNAEYLQVYTETFDRRFFFEIVQRKDYRGYGAANAPVRLAAQARLSATRLP